MNFNEQQNRRRIYGSTRRMGSSTNYVTGDSRTRGPNNRGSSTGNRQTSNKRPTQDTHATRRCYSRNRSHASQGRNNPSDSDMRKDPEPISGGNDTQAGLSRDATSMATAVEPLKQSLRGYLEPMNVVESPEGFLRKTTMQCSYQQLGSDTWQTALKNLIDLESRAKEVGLLLNQKNVFSRKTLFPLLGSALSSVRCSNGFVASSNLGIWTTWHSVTHGKQP